MGLAWIAEPGLPSAFDTLHFPADTWTQENWALVFSSRLAPGGKMNTLFLPELREMLAENNAHDLQEFCTALNPARTAEFMEGLDPAESWRVLRHADLKLREQIFLYLG